MDRSGRGTGGSDSGGSDQRGGGRPRGAGPEPNLSGLGGMGIQFVVVLLVFLFIGKWLDARLGTSPWLLILGVFVGATASIYAMYRKVFPPEPPKPPGPGSSR